MIFVKTDSRGKMIPSELEKEINTCKTKVRDREAINIMIKDIENTTFGVNVYWIKH